MLHEKVRLAIAEAQKEWDFQATDPSRPENMSPMVWDAYLMQRLIHRLANILLMAKNYD